MVKLTKEPVFIEVGDILVPAKHFRGAVASECTAVRSDGFEWRDVTGRKGFTKFTLFQAMTNELGWQLIKSRGVARTSLNERDEHLLYSRYLECVKTLVPAKQYLLTAEQDNLSAQAVLVQAATAHGSDSDEAVLAQTAADKALDRVKTARMVVARIKAEMADAEQTLANNIQIVI